MLRFKLWYEKVMINMDAYTSFASVYDMFMDNIPYGEWCAYLTSLLKEYGVEDGILLDLGCGTGSLTELLAQEGYDMIGVDFQRICFRSQWRRGKSRDFRFCIFCRICGSLSCTGLSGQS